MSTGLDYVLSEVVHCKSRQERGVRTSLEECINRFLRRLIAESKAKVVVCLGKVADDAVRRTFNLSDDTSVSEPVRVGVDEKVFAFLPHPNSREPRSFERCLSGEELACLRRILATGESLVRS